jgi:hypothetical protein
VSYADQLEPLPVRSHDWPLDINLMHQKYGFHEAVKDFPAWKLKALLEFRINFLKEELKELDQATSADDVVDALVDLCVVAIGTLDIFGVDAHEAWDRVHVANMSKRIGVKETRPNPLGMPDLIKPEGWEAPVHEDNLGRLADVFDRG